MTATDSGMKGASSAELGGVAGGCASNWDSGLVSRCMTTVCFYRNQTALTGSLPLAQKADWPPSPCHTALLIYTLEARQPRSTASQHASTAAGHGEPSQAPAASRCCRLQSTDPCLGKTGCTQNLPGEVATHALPAAPNSCSLSAPEPLSTARRGCRLAQVPAQGLAPKSRARKAAQLQRTHSE